MLDRGSKISGSRVRAHSAMSLVSQAIIELLVATKIQKVLLLPVTSVPASAQKKMKLTKSLTILDPRAAARVSWVIFTQSVLSFIRFYSVPS